MNEREMSRLEELLVKATMTLPGEERVEFTLLFLKLSAFVKARVNELRGITKSSPEPLN